MAVLKDQEIEALISCEKVVTDDSRRTMRTDGSQRRADLKLESPDGTSKFGIFIRQSTEFLENFSVGLKYEPRDGGDGIILFRCNGPHGPSNGVISGNHHPHPHIHLATEENLDRGARAERGGRVTSEYANLTEAVRYFTSRINFPLDQLNRCFPLINPSLFIDDEDI